MPEFTKCPYCGLSEFSTRSARDNHVHRCKQKKTARSISQSDSSSNKHESKPPELYTRFDGRKAPLTEAELISEGIDWMKSKITSKKSNSQPEESVRQLTVTELAEQRVRELNGESLSQFESYTPSSEEQHTQAQAQSQPSEQIASRSTFNVTQAIRSVVSKIFPQKKKQEFPDNTYNEWGMPLFHWKCLSCNNWVSTNDVALHQAEGHSVVYVG